MKILYHHRTLSRDGQDVHITEMIAAFRRAGHEVRIVAPEAHTESGFGSEGGFLSRLRAALPSVITEWLELAYSFVAYRQLKAAYHEFEPDLLYERYNLFTLSGMWLHKRTDIPFFVEINAPLAEERSRYGGLFWERLARWTENSVWRAADAVLPVTNELANYVRRANVAENRIHVIPNGIDPAKFSSDLDDTQIRRQLGLGTRTVIGFTGFLRDWHGLPNVVDAMAGLIPDVDAHFLVVGDGPARADVEQQAKLRGISDRVTVTGLVQRSEVAAYQAAYDVAVQPEATSYASPLKLFEYMALGHAIIAPDQPNLREVLEHDKNALLFAPGDKQAFTDTLQRLVTDGTLRQRLGQAAADAVTAMPYTWDGNAQRVIELAAKGRSL